MDSQFAQGTENEAREEPQTGSGQPDPTTEQRYIRIPHTSAYQSGSATSGRDRGKPRPEGVSTGLPGTLRVLMLSGMLVLGMLLGGAGAGAVMLVAGGASTLAAPAQTAQATTTTTASSNSSPELVAQSSQTTINSIYEKVSPSVVMISSVVRSGNGRFSATGQATGTGIVIDSQGHILTNYHVIEGATSIKIELSDGSEYTATVVGTAPQDDLALIQADVPGDKLVPASLGDSSTVQVGDEVIAIGYPYSLDQSVTSGIVSGLNRDGAGSDGSRTLTGLIQVDAAINPGNSGGPLLNAQGQVIGINTMIESPVEGFTGVGLAIPINQARALFSQLEQGGTVERPWMGISGIEITTALQQEYNLPVSQGILVMDVTAGSPAAKAGLQGSTVASTQGQFPGSQQSQISSTGDIIVAIDGHNVGTVAELTGYLNSKQPGDQVTLTIMRGGRQQSVAVTLQAWSTSASSNATGSDA
jgi:S1-C subfamily serine protease